MDVIFYISAAVAVISTFLVITRLQPVHALLWFILSLFSVAVLFYTAGAPFVAALEVVIYAGAIMVLFLFAVMLLNLGPEVVQQEKSWLPGRSWIAPVVLAGLLALELIVVGRAGTGPPSADRALRTISPREVGATLFGPYLLGVEMVGLLLLAGLVGAYHLGRRDAVWENWPSGPDEPQGRLVGPGGRSVGQIAPDQPREERPAELRGLDWGDKR